jgi:inositol-pentakisphosphate 2-kinase
MASIVNTDPKDWRYVSEGGATIVFSYHGPPNPDFDGTVLRLRKALVPSLKSVVKIRDGEVYKPHAQDGEEEPDDPTIEYQTKCMAKLIPPEHLPRLETVKLDQEWLQRLAQLENLKRPEARREKDGIDVDRRKGVLATDLVGGNWLAVEIKVLIHFEFHFFEQSLTPLFPTSA